MKLFLFISGLILVNAKVPYVPIAVDYHEKIGIPEATRIQKAEAAMDFDGSRIIGGSSPDLGVHPYIAGLLITLVDGRLSMCGASLLSNTRLVTAARCWRSQGVQGSLIEVVLASTHLFSGGTRIFTSNIQVHENYNEDNLNNDIAVITIPHVAYNNNIQNIELPSGIFLSLTYSGEEVVAAGYGRTSDIGSHSDPSLHHTSLRVLHNWDCSSIYGLDTVLTSTLCTDGVGPVGTCAGDFGGPLVYTFQGNRYLVGVISFTALNGCETNLPAGHARVTSFASWIRARL